MEEKKLPENWILTEVSKIGKVLSGSGFPKKFQGSTTGQYPFFKVGDISRNVKLGKTYIMESDNSIDEEVKRTIKAKILPQNSIVFAKIGEALKLNRRAILNQDSIVDNNAIGIKTNEVILNHKLFFYFLKTLDLSEYSAGNAVPSVRKSTIELITLPLPPRPEQDRIVAKVDTLMVQVEIMQKSMERIPQLLKDFRQQVLTQAVTGKLTNSQIKENYLGELLSEVKYGTSKKSLPDVEGTPIFRIPNIQDGEINDDDLKFSKLDKKEFDNLKLKEGDVLIIRSNGSVSIVGKSAIIRKVHVDYSYAGYLIRLRCKNSLNPEFLNYSLQSNFMRTQIVDTARSTSGVNNINSTEIKELRILLPKTIEEQQEIVGRVESLFIKADAIEQKYKTLKTKIDTLPQAILHKAFKGELVEQLASDGDARALLREIENLKKTTPKNAKVHG